MPNVVEPFVHVGLSRVHNVKQANCLALEPLLNRMYPTTIKVKSHDSQPPSLANRNDFLTRKQFEGQKIFLDQIKSFITENNEQRFFDLIQQCPNELSRVSPQELGDLLLFAVKAGRSKMLKPLITGGERGKAASLPMETQLDWVEAARLDQGSQAALSELLNALLGDSDFPAQHLDTLENAAGEANKPSLASELATYRREFQQNRTKAYAPYQQAIYDAAAEGDVCSLQTALDAQLGIPPLDDNLTGPAWLFNILHRWVAGLFAKSAATALVNKKMGELPLLHAAVASGKKDVVLLLIEKGVDMSALDQQGQTALAKARALNQVELITILLDCGAPDFSNTGSGFLQPTAAADARYGNVHTAVVHQHRENVVSPSNSRDLMQLFRKLMPDVESSLSPTGLLQEKLNNGKDFSNSQRPLLVAGYMADFVPPRDPDAAHRKQASAAEADSVAQQLRRHADDFISRGVSLQNSIAEDIYRVLDNITSVEFGHLCSSPDEVRRNLLNAGLCNRLIEVVVEVRNAAVADPKWGLALASRQRRSILADCLREKLRQMNNVIASMKKREKHDPAVSIAYQLLDRQVTLLEDFCATPVGDRQAIPLQTQYF